MTCGFSLLMAAMLAVTPFFSGPAFASPQDSEAPIMINDAYSFATAEGQTTGAAFMLITNATGDDRIVSAQSPVAGTVELHEHVMDGDVMGMRKVDSISVPGGQTIKLQPMGYHLMLIDLKAPLVVGEEVPVTLTFEANGSFDVVAKVVPPGTALESHDMDHSGHDMVPAQ